jgi:type IV pilus assembly protein PilP
VSVGDKTQHVQVGQYIGQNYGRIVRVGDQELTLRELVREGTTEWKEKMTTLKVQEGAQ